MAIGEDISVLPRGPLRRELDIDLRLFVTTEETDDRLSAGAEEVRCSNQRCAACIEEGAVAGTSFVAF